MKHDICPVCGYAEMPYPPVPENICPCCGTQYGFDDYFHTPTELRLRWIRAGFPWFDDITRPPKNWSPALQLIKAGYDADLIRPSGSKTKSDRKVENLTTTSVWDIAQLNVLTVTIGAPHLHRG